MTAKQIVFISRHIYERCFNGVKKWKRGFLEMEIAGIDPTLMIDFVTWGWLIQVISRGGGSLSVLDIIKNCDFTPYKNGYVLITPIGKDVNNSMFIFYF